MEYKTNEWIYGWNAYNKCKSFHSCSHCSPNDSVLNCHSNNAFFITSDVY